MKTFTHFIEVWKSHTFNRIFHTSPFSVDIIHTLEGDPETNEKGRSTVAIFKIYPKN